MNHFSYLFFLLSNSEGKAGSSEGAARLSSHRLPPSRLRTAWNTRPRDLDCPWDSALHQAERSHRDNAPTLGESPPDPPVTPPNGWGGDVPWEPGERPEGQEK